MIYSALELNKLYLCQDPQHNFTALIALEDIGCNSAMGGCRFVEYTSLAMAIEDVSRLAKAMTYKAVISGLPYNGGKAVLIKPKGKFNRNLFLKKFAHFVNSFHGKYITTIDSGTTSKDMLVIQRHTSFVTGCFNKINHSDPAFSTAFGVFKAMEAGIKIVTGASSLQQKHIIIQGLGKVGLHLATLLHSAGAELTICDTQYALVQQHADRLNARIVSPDDIYSISCDIFAPCALSHAITSSTIERMQCKIIAGAANAQLSSIDMLDKLDNKGIFYLPDFVINAGGLIHLALQSNGASLEQIQQHILLIEERILTFCQDIKLSSKNLYNKVMSYIYDKIGNHRSIIVSQ